METFVQFKKADAELHLVFGEVPGYPGYKVGTDGTVISPYSERALTPVKHTNGYTHVDLRKGGKKKRVGVHCLVLLVHVGPRPKGHTAAHRNGIRDDNRLENLYWATWQEQWADKERHGTYQRGEKIGTAILTESKVREIKSRLGKDPYSILMKEFKVSKSCLSMISTGRNWAWVQ